GSDRGSPATRPCCPAYRRAVRAEDRMPRSDGYPGGSPAHRANERGCESPRRDGPEDPRDARRAACAARAPPASDQSHTSYGELERESVGVMKIRFTGRVAERPVREPTIILFEDCGQCDLQMTRCPQLRKCTQTNGGGQFESLVEIPYRDLRRMLEIG